MHTRIELSNWSVKTDKEGAKKIAGTYKVMCGPTEIANASFNDGYGATSINIPPEVLSKALEVDALVRDAIEKNFTA